MLVLVLLLVLLLYHDNTMVVGRNCGCVLRVFLFCVMMMSMKMMLTYAILHVKHARTQYDRTVSMP